MIQGLQTLFLSLGRRASGLGKRGEGKGLRTKGWKNLQVRVSVVLTAKAVAITFNNESLGIGVEFPVLQPLINLFC